LFGIKKHIELKKEKKAILTFLSKYDSVNPAAKKRTTKYTYIEFLFVFIIGYKKEIKNNIIPIKPEDNPI
jgi:hypothetical protein